MKIRIVFDLDEYARRSIANYYGRQELASYKSCKIWIEGLINATLDDLADDLDKAKEAEQEVEGE